MPLECFDVIWIQRSCHLVSIIKPLLAQKISPYTVIFRHVTPLKEGENITVDGFSVFNNGKREILYVVCGSILNDFDR